MIRALLHCGTKHIAIHNKIGWSTYWWVPKAVSVLGTAASYRPCPLALKDSSCGVPFLPFVRLPFN